MAFGNRLKLLREERGLTQQMIADILKVERPTIAGYETNRKQPDYQKINVLADYFNVSLDYLLGRSDIRNPYIEKNLDETKQSEPRDRLKEDTPYEKISKLVKENEIKTLAAHFDGEDITDDDVEDIKNFIEFVVQKRKKKNK